MFLHLNLIKNAEIHIYRLFQLWASYNSSVLKLLPNHLVKTVPLVSFFQVEQSFMLNIKRTSKRS